ncbi:SemiSWEET family transporter [Myroides injenensis]|uniref:SemiSWEET family transporter n=1 Tax=Myroides injenensis TaxID=1183151 RepID=UPI00028928F1|nr:SemiSWEET family transporter [Myroides injenensis]
MDTKFIRVLGIVATIMSIAMYVSYIPQIIGNIRGDKGDYIQPLVAAINCSLWVTYGAKRKDWPLAAANMPGILFGLIACFTALYNF